MTYALENQAGVQVRAPFVSAAMTRKAGAETLDFATVAVVAATPAAVMLALVAERLAAKLLLTSLAATFFEPASAHGREAMDELHQQTVNLLSLQEIPREQYDAQVAFNVLPKLGDDAKVDLGTSAKRIARHYGLVTKGLPELELQVVHGPVFHGYVASVLLEVDREVRVDEVERALAGEGIDVVSEDSDPAEQPECGGPGRRHGDGATGAAGCGTCSEPAFLALARGG